MSRRYADYEYTTRRGKLRVERNNKGDWVWRYFGNDGSYESSNDLGEAYRLKRDAKADGIAFAKHKEL